MTDKVALRTFLNAIRGVEIVSGKYPPGNF